MSQATAPAHARLIRRTPRSLVISVAAGLLALSVPAAASAGTAYVPSRSPHSIGTIDTLTNVVGPVISTTLPSWAIAITPDGKTAYLANQDDDAVTPIDLATETLSPPIAVGDSPQSIAITPDGATVYVGNSGSNSVTPIDTATNTAGTPITSGINTPLGLAVSPDGATVFVTNFFGGTVTPIDTATNTAGAPIAAGPNPLALAIAPDGATLYVSNFTFNQLTPIDTATGTAGTPIPVGFHPTGIAITPDGATAYAVNQDSNDVTPIDTATNTAGAPIGVGISPRTAAVTPDGETLYVVNGGTHSVTPIDTDTNVADPEFFVVFNAFSIAIGPGQAPIAAFSGTPGKPLTANLDASASTVPDGVVASYEWDFGDGQTDTMTGPKADHVYAAPGTYTVTLTETSADGCSTAFTYTGQTVSCNGSKSAIVEHDVTVDLTDHTPPPPVDPPAPEEHPAATPPAAEATPAAPVVAEPKPTGPTRKLAPKPVRQAIERFTLDARCLRPSRTGSAHVGVNVRLARPGAVAVQVDRATDAQALDRCPPRGSKRTYTGRMRDLKTTKGIQMRSASVDRTLALDLRLAPGLYRIAVRAHTEGGLTRPAYRWVRVLR